MKALTKRLALSGVVLVLGALAWGQNGTIAGTATDSTNRLVPSATVTVCAAGASITLTNPVGSQCSPTAVIYSGPSSSSTQLPNPITGDAQGRFQFWAPPGQYVMQVAGTGLTTQTTNIVVAPDLTNLVLQELSADPAAPASGDQLYAIAGQICVKSSGGVKTCITGSASNVTSFNSRTGGVLPQAGDYTAALVQNAFDITAINTLTAVAAPAGNPAAGFCFYWLDSGTGVFTSRNSSGGSCSPTGGSVTNLTFPVVPSWLSFTVANPTSTPAVTVAGTAQTPGLVLASNCNYGASSAAVSPRALCGEDLPTFAITALDNSVQSGSVDANNNPNYLLPTGTGGVVGNKVGIACTSTPLTMAIAGKKFVCLADKLNVSLGGTDALYYVFAIADPTFSALGSGDFITSTIPPLYSPLQPVCSNGGNLANGAGGFFAAASATNPEYWFNTGTNTMNLCNSSGGSFTPLAATGVGPFSAILLGACHGTGAASDKCVTDPFGMTPGRRIVLFGDGHDGNLQLTSGTTTKDGVFYFNSCFFNGALTLAHTGAAVNNNTTGLIMRCQLPTIIMGNAVISANAKGRTHTGGTANNGASANAGGMGGGGGNGGGGNTGTGGAGGVEALMWSPNVATATPAVTATNTGGANGPAVTATVAVANLPFVDEPYVSFFMGAPGGNGGGDGTNFGGAGGDGGGVVLLKVPSLLVVGSGGTCGSNQSCITANGGAGSNASVAGSGNGGGGAGGGGAAELVAGYANFENCTLAQVLAGTCSQLTATGGVKGTHLGGSAGDGGNGGAGLNKYKKAF